MATKRTTAKSEASVPQQRNWGLGDRLLKHFTDNQDEVVTVETLAKVGSTTVERAKRQIALMRNRNAGNIVRHLETVTPGKEWRWCSVARTFEQEKSTPLARKMAAEKVEAEAEATGSQVKNGADLLRDMARRLREGEFNLPEMIRQLDGMAIGLDVIYEEMANTDLRTLQRKAALWDRAEAMLSEVKK